MLFFTKFFPLLDSETYIFDMLLKISREKVWGTYDSFINFKDSLTNKTKPK